MSLSDAENTFKGALIAAADDALGPFVEQVQAEQQAALTQAQADVAALTTEVDTLTAQGERDRQALAANDETIKALEQRHASDAATITQQAARIQQLESQAPVARLLVGATLRGSDKTDAVTRPRPVWDITRVYNIGDALKVDGLVAVSFGSILGKGWSASQAKITGLKTALGQVPDVAGQRVGDTHEFDNPTKYGTDSKTYLADAAAFKRAVDDVNATRVNPLIIFRCCMAYSLSVPSRNIDEFYLQDPQNYDEFGPDVYKLPDIAKAVEKATQYGKPLCIPEFGPLDNVAHTDPAILDEMQQGIAAWGDAVWVAWFDKKGAGADLDQYPNALAYWGSQTAA